MSMGEVGESGNRETQRVSVQMNGLPGDLLQRVIAGNLFPRKFEEAASEETGEIELSLGLSLNGRFGVDPKKAKMLTWSSSISDFMTPLRYQDRASTVLPITALTRTCSLPMETEEEWRKRKELQTLRRLEAKRKRTAKQRSYKTARSRDRDRASLEENCEEDKVVEDKPQWGNTTPPPPPPPPLPPSSQGSVGSQRSSSGISEFESQPMQDHAVLEWQGNPMLYHCIEFVQGMPEWIGRTLFITKFDSIHLVQVKGVNKCSEARSPASIQSLPGQSEQKPLISPGTPEKSGKVGGVVAENQPKKPTISSRGVSEMARKVMEDMPCVSTTGDGPNGKKVDGFLYRYKKGEEVRIVCVCHGSFLSPAEFVKHAGGSDVAHPLRHIVVYPSSLL
ncbi:Ninja-family protein MODD [Vitis vinifera]|uniref:Ninja-family protein n=1 Tax=Vitis vinifera TaxID=29760 RepID=A0A438HE54_VITVI|nr:Ninja-family protein MODD [Vitis vinifera]